jgi:mono/diheme cytochrome c family protein
MSDATVAEFSAIVLGGLRHQGGMPGFAERLEPANAEDLLAYLLSLRGGAAAEG